jgi:hypothetical protein
MSDVRLEPGCGSRLSIQKNSSDHTNRHQHTHTRARKQGRDWKQEGGGRSRNQRGGEREERRHPQQRAQGASSPIDASDNGSGDVRGVRAKVTGERGTIQIHREAAPLHLDIGLQHRRAVHQTTDTERRGEKGWRGEERRGEDGKAQELREPATRREVGRLLGVLELLREPVQALVQTLAVGRARGLSHGVSNTGRRCCEKNSHKNKHQ